MKDWSTLAHIKNIHLKSFVICDKCGDLFKSHTDMRKHYRKCTKKPTREPCEVKIANQTSVDEKLIECPRCLKKFESNIDLFIYDRNEYKFLCRGCGKHLKKNRSFSARQGIPVSFKHAICTN